MWEDSVKTEGNMNVTPGGLPGTGGTRKGYVARNEIEDMTLFDADPGKSPTANSRKGDGFKNGEGYLKSLFRSVQKLFGASH